MAKGLQVTSTLAENGKAFRHASIAPTAGFASRSNHKGRWKAALCFCVLACKRQFIPAAD
jgi:hypothetical protein